MTRMLAQLLIIGYFLVYLFEAESLLLVSAVLSIMVIASSWIALRTIPVQRRCLYKHALVSILAGGGIPLLVIIVGVVPVEPWYAPRFVIPLAGMIFANGMNSVSLAAERIHAECKHQAVYSEARKTAFKASLIPLLNAFFAVGIVSFPGMMTGQILSGVSPLIAARYQIVVMCMVFASAGLSSAFFLILIKSRFNRVTS